MPAKLLYIFQVCQRSHGETSGLGGWLNQNAGISLSYYLVSNCTVSAVQSGCNPLNCLPETTHWQELFRRLNMLLLISV